MMNDEEKYSLCALNRIFGFEPKVAHALLSHLGNASDIFRMKETEINAILGPWSKYRGRICGRTLDEAAEEIRKLEEKGVSFIGCTEKDYPELLKDCDDAPIGLYLRSRTPADKLFAPERKIAVVGTRDISPYGQEWCSRIVSQMGRASEKPVIVSGLALGTDICAHSNALESGLPTIAVMATGPENVYPHRHMDMAERMASTEGCGLITDYPPGTAPLAIHFLRRNRIIAGLSDTTILIESRIKGGGMMTSRLAFSYNRDVYALPGRVDDVTSQGCNLLIKNKTAESIDSVEGLMESLRLDTGKPLRTLSASELVRETFGSRAGEGLVSELSSLLASIRKHRGITLDDLCALTSSDYSRISRLAGMLESEGLISIDLLQRCTVTTRFSR